MTNTYLPSIIEAKRRFSGSEPNSWHAALWVVCLCLSLETVCRCGVRSGPNHHATKGRNSPGDQRAVEQDRAATRPGSESPKGLLRTGVPWGEMDAVWYHFAGNISFLTAGHLRAFKEYGMMLQERDVLCRPMWPGNAFRPRWSNIQ